MSPEYGSGSGTQRVFIVEARTSYNQPQIHCGMILDAQWRRVSFPTSTVGVSVCLHGGEPDRHGFLNYEAAMALAHWFMAQPDDSLKVWPALCVETRLIEIEFKHSYSTAEIGIGPTMSHIDMRRATTFTPRETKAEGAI